MIEKRQRHPEQIFDEQIISARSLVLEGIQQAERGKLKDFDKVCDRLERKYRTAAVSN